MLISETFGYLSVQVSNTYIHWMSMVIRETFGYLSIQVSNTYIHVNGN